MLWEFRGRRDDFSQEGKKTFHGKQAACDLNLQGWLAFAGRIKGKGIPSGLKKQHKQKAGDGNKQGIVKW